MTKKQSSWLWFLLAVLPIVLIIISTLTISDNGNINTAPLLQSIGFNADYEETVNNSVENDNQSFKYCIYFMEPSQESLEGIITNYMVKLMTNNDNYFIPQYVAYLIRLYIIKIAFNVFLLLPKICNRLINKAIGSGEVE